MDYKIGFIGCGNMAQAIIGGIRKKMKEQVIFVYDINKQKYDDLKKFNLNCCEEPKDVILNSDFIFLAIKPQQITEVMEEIKEYVKGKTVVSILAGVSTDYIRKLCNLQDLQVIRVMPNTPLMVGEGATALCATSNIEQEKFNFVCNIFASSGSIAKISESKMNEIININGSSPAYIFLFTIAVMKYAENKGIDYNTALELFCQTLVGSAKMMLTSGKTPEELKVMVTSPGGTTLAALNVFEDNNFVDIILEAFEACARRAEELGK